MTVSETIRVRSIVGRFLEHSRIYYFMNGGDEELYIGSADLMERNLDRRVETLVPVRDAEIREHLRDVVLNAYLQDTDRAMVLAALELAPALDQLSAPAQCSARRVALDLDHRREERDGDA